MVLSICKITKEAQMQKILKSFDSVLLHLDEWSEWTYDTSDIKNLTCVVYADSKPVALFTFDITCGYLSLLDVAEAYQNRGIGKIILYLLFCKFSYLYQITGDSTPEALLFWVRVGACFDKSLYQLYYSMYEAAEEGESFPFVPFTLTAPRYKAYLMSTNFVDNWSKAFNCNLNNVIWK